MLSDATGMKKTARFDSLLDSKITLYVCVTTRIDAILLAAETKTVGASCLVLRKSSINMSSSDSETTCNHQEEDFAIDSDYEDVSDGESMLPNRHESRHQWSESHLANWLKFTNINAFWLIVVTTRG